MPGDSTASAVPSARDAARAVMCPRALVILAYHRVSGVDSGILGNRRGRICTRRYTRGCGRIFRVRNYRLITDEAANLPRRRPEQPAAVRALPLAQPGRKSPAVTGLAAEAASP